MGIAILVERAGEGGVERPGRRDWEVCYAKARKLMNSDYTVVVVVLAVKKILLHLS